LHFAAGDLPRQTQPVVEAVLYPVGRELGRQVQVERACVLAETAELNRLDPLAEQLVAQILAQPLADVSPIGGEVDGVLILDLPQLTALPFGCRMPGMRANSNHFEPAPSAMTQTPRNDTVRAMLRPSPESPFCKGRRPPIVVSI